MLFEEESDPNYKLYAIGGSLNFIEFYDSVAARWTMLEVLKFDIPANLGIFSTSCCLLPSGMILISGGSSDNKSKALNSVYSFNADTSSLT